MPRDKLTPCGYCEWCRFTLGLLGKAYASLCLKPRPPYQQAQQAQHPKDE